MIFGVDMLCLNALWQLHVHVQLNGRMWVCHDDKINLMHGSVEEDAEYNHEPDGKPCHYWGMGFIIVYPILLHASM